MSSFRQKVIQLVNMVPFGKVASYGQIALYAGVPKAAREVGWILKITEGKNNIPWWRIVNNKGYISIKGAKYAHKELQRRLLCSEGIPVTEQFTLPIERYRWKLSEEDAKKLQLPEEYTKLIMERMRI